MNESRVNDASPSCKLGKLFDSRFVDDYSSTPHEECQFDRHIDFKPDGERSENCPAWNVSTRQALAMMDGHRMGPSLADFYIDGQKD